MKIRGNLDITGKLILPNGSKEGKAIYARGHLGEVEWRHLHIREVDPNESYGYGSLVISIAKEVHIAIDNGAPGNDLTSAKWDSVGSGTSGTVGPQGPQGPDGPEGLRGPDGKDGQQGADGAKGQDGKDGLKGDQGPAGTGVTIKGADTYAKIIIKTGAPGDMWLTTDDDLAATPPYDIGYGVVYDGATWTIVGQIQGPAGPGGTPGNIGATGPEGPIGPIGPVGKKGVPGEKGDKGDIGQDGAAANTALIPILYDDLKTAAIGGKLVPGNRYLLKDYTSGERVVVMAASTGTLYNETSSLDNPNHTMEYNPDWGNTTNKGYIFNRADVSRGIFTREDFMFDKVRRYKVKPIESYTSGTSYGKYITVQGGGAMYMSLKDANIEPLSDTSAWSEIFIAHPGDPLVGFESYIGTDSGTPMPFGLMFDSNDFKDYFIFHKANGSNGWESANNVRIEGKGNCLIFENAVNEVHLGVSVTDNTFISNDIDNIMFVANRVSGVVIAGEINNIALNPGAVFIDSYLQGARNLVIDGAFSTTMAVSRSNFSVGTRKVAEDSIIHLSGCYVNVNVPIGTSNLLLNSTTVLGKIKGAGSLVLNDSFIRESAEITNSSIYANTASASSDGANKTNEILGIFTDVNLRGIEDCSLDGRFTKVTASHWEGIHTTNSAVLENASFYIARWYRKSGAPEIDLRLKDMMVERVYTSVGESDKIWSSEFDVNGIEIVKEII